MTAHSSDAPVQAAPSAAPNPIGHIDTATGLVQVTHADGAVELLSNGDPVYQGDFLVTGENAAVGMVFMDETVFSMGEFSRMTLDEMVYDAEAATGSLVFSLARGAFTFVSGQIAKTSPEGMAFKTPSALIGIRGSAGGINVNDLGQTLATLFEELGNIFGEMTFTTGAGTEIVNQPLLALRALGYNAPPSSPFDMTIEDMGANFGSALRALPNAVEHLPPAFRAEVDKVFTGIQAARVAVEDGPGDHPNGPVDRGDFIALDGAPLADSIPAGALGVMESLGYSNFTDLLDYLRALVTVIQKHQIRYTPETTSSSPEPETFQATNGADSFSGNAASTKYVFDQGSGMDVTDNGSDFYDANPGIASIANKDTITDAGGSYDRIVLYNLNYVGITFVEATDTSFVTAKIYDLSNITSDIDESSIPDDNNLYNIANVTKGVDYVRASTTGSGGVFIPGAPSDISTGETGYIVAGGANADTIDLSGKASPVGSLIFGKGNADTLTGTTAGDKIYGGDGNDTIIGGKGADTMKGGNGSDIFRYTAFADLADASSPDLIKDFTQSDDSLSFGDGSTGIAFPSQGGGGSGSPYVSNATNFKDGLAASANISAEGMIFDFDSAVLSTAQNFTGATSAQIITAAMNLLSTVTVSSHSTNGVQDNLFIVYDNDGADAAILRFQSTSTNDTGIDSAELSVVAVLTDVTTSDLAMADFTV